MAAHDRQDRLNRALTDFARLTTRLGLSAAWPPGAGASAAQHQAFIKQVGEQLGVARQQAEGEQTRLQQRLAAGARQAGDDAGWRRLEDAVRKVEGELRAASSLRARLDEGRRSMKPKVDSLIQQSLQPEVRQQRGVLVASIAPAGLDSLAGALPQWVEAWSRYTCGWLDMDLQRVVQEAWTPREGDLPLPPPTIRPLEPRAVHTSVDLPDLSLDREQIKLGAGLYRHARSVLYGILSLTFLLGLRSGGSQQRDPFHVVLLVVGMLVAIIIGYTQVQAERDKEKARLAEDLVKRGRKEVHDAVYHGLTRAADRLTDDIQTQLFERRQDLVAWYRGQVLPALQRREQEMRTQAQEVERARRRLPRVKEHLRDLSRAGDELARLSGLVSGQG